MGNLTARAQENDALLWAEQQAALVRSGRFGELDYEGILEELENMGREQRVALQSLFRQILIHLLKLDYSPAGSALHVFLTRQARTHID
ncbi:DUF29 family protein [Halochromatium roseum]|uniref:DUF29 family protein n=1 Tax=Halochromatium roseum TaxID=391920 RepID=UPI001911F2C4|nr:hypothetical protein [Halochromatium roseum]